jgi:chemotaxis protein histidine kinase CheA
MSSSERNNSTSGSGMTIDIRPMIEDVSQVMTKHITNILSGVIGEYTIYKETHDTIMGLPCVRKLQERISELEQDGSGGGGVASAAAASRSGSREEEVAQLQSAIEDLNRYIHALESKVNMKQVSSGADAEESVRLEIHETDEGDGDDDGDECDEHLCESTVETSSHKNVIITSEAVEEAEAEQDDAEAEAEDAEAEDAEAEEDAEEAEAEAEDAEADAEAAEDAEAEEEDAEAEEAEAEDAEAEDAEAQPEPEPEEEETEEVEEVKIKGKTYFTTNPQNGIIYACVDDDVGDEVGVFKNGVAVFNKGKK